MKRTNINNIIMHAYNTVPFYKDLYDKNKINPQEIQTAKDLIKLPIINKKTVRLNQKNMISKKYNVDDLIVERTSGSTGIPLYIYKSREDKVMQGLAFWNKRNSQFMVSPKSKYCIFHILSHNKDIDSIEPIIRHDNCISFCRLKFTEEFLHMYAREMMEFKPEWLFGGIESWWVMAKFMKKYGYKPPNTIKFIESTGALISEECRKNVSNFFNCKVIDGYGCREVYGIGYECMYGNMHCLENNVIVEIVREGVPVAEGEEGEIVITSLNNKAMPFIRYLLGDVGKIIKNYKCSCGCDSKIIKLSKGRNSDLIQFNDGREPLSASCVYFAIDSINRQQKYSILQFKFVQKTYSSFELIVEFEPTMSVVNMDDFRMIFLNEMKRYHLEDYNWMLYNVHTIEPDKKTGKLQYFYSEIDEDAANMN